MKVKNTEFPGRARRKDMDFEGLCLWVWIHLRITWDFPGGPGVRTPCFHCRRHRFDLWSGN